LSCDKAFLLVHPQFSSLGALLPRRQPSTPGWEQTETWSHRRGEKAILTPFRPLPMLCSPAFRAGSKEQCPFSLAGNKRQVSPKKDERKKKQAFSRATARSQQD